MVREAYRTIIKRFCDTWIMCGTLRAPMFLAPSLRVPLLALLGAVRG